jgi:hypothetical protein
MAAIDNCDNLLSVPNEQYNLYLHCPLYDGLNGMTWTNRKRMLRNKVRKNRATLFTLKEAAQKLSDFQRKGVNARRKKSVKPKRLISISTECSESMFKLDSIQPCSEDLYQVAGGNEYLADTSRMQSAIIVLD